MGWEYFCDYFFSYAASQGLISYSWKYNVCSIKSEMKVLLLHEIRV